MLGKKDAVLLLAGALFALCATPALSCTNTSTVAKTAVSTTAKTTAPTTNAAECIPDFYAQITLDCTSYSINVTAWDLSPGTTYTLEYTINLTPNSASGSPSGPVETIVDSITFTPNQDNGYGYIGTVTKGLGPLNGANFMPVPLGSAELIQAGIPLASEVLGFSDSSWWFTCAPPPAPSCTAKTTNTSNFNGTSISGGDYIWFNANFTASGVPKTGATLTFTGSTISFTDNDNHSYDVEVPNGTITFSPTATCASTSFDSVSNTFATTLPIAGSDEILLTGLAFPVPATFGGKVPGNVTWSGTLGTNTPGVSMNWKWGAAVYTEFSGNYNTLSVKPAHSSTCSYNNSDHAGTPEGVNPNGGKSFESFVTGGARGGGGSNFTGSWSGTVGVKPACPGIQ